MKPILIIIFLLCAIVSCAFADESVKLGFDMNDWKLGYNVTKGTDSILEFVPSGEAIGSWSELLTIQSFKGLQQKTTPAEFAQTMKRQLAETCPQFSWKILESTYAGVMYEWTVAGCPGQFDQQEIAIVISGNQALYVIHYATKKLPLSAEQEQEWINKLRLVTIIAGKPTLTKDWKRIE